MSEFPHLFTAIDHVGVAVADLDEAKQFYERTFGMQLIQAGGGQRGAGRPRGDDVGRRLGLVRAACLPPLTPESTIAKFLDRSGPGVQQVAFRVEDVDEASTMLRERGLRLLYDTPRRGTAGSRAELRAPEGRRRGPRRAGGAGRPSLTGPLPSLRYPGTAVL